MMKNLKRILGVMLVILCLCLGLQAADSDLLPPPGSKLRKEVLDALRQEVKRIHALDVVFVVRHLKVKEGWAWVQAFPQSADGSNKYEDMSALLQLQDSSWAVVEIPCGEEENPDCLHGPEYFSGLRKRFQRVPAEIFPEGSSGDF